MVKIKNFTLAFKNLVAYTYTTPAHGPNSALYVDSAFAFIKTSFH